jgi:hypothetical protein
MLIWRRRRIIFNIEQGTARSTLKILPIRAIEISQERNCELVTIDLFATANPSFGGSIQRHR